MGRNKAKASLNTTRREEPQAKQPPVGGRSKRPRRGEGSSSTPSAVTYDSDKFRSVGKRNRYFELKIHPFLTEKRVQLNKELNTEFWTEVCHRGWIGLASPSEFYDPEVVLEFYANAYPEKGERTSRRNNTVYVRGVEVSYDRDAIADIIKTDYVLGYDMFHGKINDCNDPFDDKVTADTICLPGRAHIHCPSGTNLNIKRANLRWEARVWSTFIQHNIAPTAHQSDTKMKYCHLIYVILKQEQVDIARVISQEIYESTVAKMKKRGSIRFPSLITTLCMRAGVPNIAPSARIADPMTDDYIKVCRRDAKAAAEQPLPPQVPAVDPGAPVTMEHFTQMMARMQLAHDHTHQQNTSIMMTLRHQQDAQYRWMEQHYQGQHSWMSPEHLLAYQVWPGDRPNYPEEGEQHADAGTDAADHDDSDGDDDDDDGAEPSDAERDAQHDLFD